MKGKWPEELLSVLWALRTTPTRPTKFGPFMLLYGDEAMTPAELGANSPRVMFSRSEEGRSARAHAQVRHKHFGNLQQKSPTHGANAWSSRPKEKGEPSSGWQA